MKVLGGALDPLAFKEATEQLVTLASHKDGMSTSLLILSTDKLIVYF